MKYLLITLVASVFLGTEILAIPTPFAQLTIYRVCALCIVPLIIYFMLQRNDHLKIKADSYASFSVVVFTFWWLWAFISFLWIKSPVRWLQSMFLLTIGISSIIGIYLWIKNFSEWQSLVKAAWLGMTFLVLMGFFEIITNHYLFADLSKLDKYNTFATQPSSRLPITVFENQNDFGVMLLAYVAVCLILYHVTPQVYKRLLLLVSTFAGSYLIYRTASRMALLALLLYLVIVFVLRFKIDFKRKHYITAIALLFTLAVLVLVFIPEARHLFLTIFSPPKEGYISGDVGRINLLKNGLLFLGCTFGFGVGAGNIEIWMEEARVFDTNNLVNIHNWWAEVLVGFGVIVFILYFVMYAFLIFRLFQIRKNQSKADRLVSNQIIAFLLAFIFSSMTSSSNMLIEWHWVFFGLIIAYIKINEQGKLFLKHQKRGKHYELNNNFR